MKRSRRILVITVSGLVLVAGAVLGLLPVTASITQVKPELRLLTAACGNGYLQTTPPVQRDDLVALPGESDVFLPRASYAAHCAQAVGWRKYGAWGLTVLGVLGLAVTFSASTASVSARSAAAARTRTGQTRGTDRSGTDRTGADRPSTGRPNTDRSAIDQPDTELPDGERSSVERSGAERPSTSSGGAHRERKG